MQDAAEQVKGARRRSTRTRSSYREVLDLTLTRLTDREGSRLSPEEQEALAYSLPN